MLVYNVTVKIDQRVEQEWLEWMKGKHVPDVMQTGKFINYRISKIDQVEEPDGSSTYSFQYLCAERSLLDDYLNNHANELREDVLAKYGNLFIAFRTIMEIVHEGDY